MASLFGSTAKTVPEFTGLQVNTSVQVLPIPIIYGAPRCSVNLIYYNGFAVEMVSQGGGGGKGLLSGGKGAKQVEYFATILLALGEGTITDTLIIYQDQAVYVPSDYPSNGFQLFIGTTPQPPWEYVEVNWPADSRPYGGTAYYAAPQAQLDSSATVPQINVVVSGALAGSCPLNYTVIAITSGQYDQNGNPISFLGDIALAYVDADPALCFYDLLQNPQYGAGFPVNWIDPEILSSADAFNPAIGDNRLSTYCQAVGFGYSTVLNNSESANSILERWSKNLVVAPVWTGELLKFIPYLGSPASGNPGWRNDNPEGIQPKYYTPNTTPIVEFTLDYILQAKNQEDDPITYSRSDPMLIYNTVRLDYKDRTNFFNDNTVENKDEAHVELFGERIDNIGLANEFTLAAYVATSAQLQVRRNVSIRRNFVFRIGPLWAFLDPMDLVQIPDPANWGNNLIVRIISIEDDDEEISTITAEEYPFGASAPTFVPTAATTPPNQGAINNPVYCTYPPLVFEPTTDMYTGQGYSVPQFIIGASSGTNNQLDPNWGGCNIWISLDNVSYEQIGVLRGPSILGQLTTGLAAYGGANPDTVNTINVNLSMSGGALSSFTDVAGVVG